MPVMHKRQHGTHKTMLDDDTIVYRVNSQDEITYVNEAWLQFAAHNHGLHLLLDDVLQRPLWDFITDLTTRQLYRDALRKARAGQSIRFHFRCDAPDLRRLLEMRIAMADEGNVEFCTRLVDAEQRPPVTLLSPLAPRTDDPLKICGWCKKVTLEDGIWVEVEEAVEQLRLFDAVVLPLLSHGICEPCYRDMCETLEEEDVDSET